MGQIKFNQYQTVTSGNGYTIGIVTNFGAADSDKAYLSDPDTARAFIRIDAFRDRTGIGLTKEQLIQHVEHCLNLIELLQENED